MVYNDFFSDILLLDIKTTKQGNMHKNGYI